MSRSQIGQFICHLWYILTMPLLMCQLAFKYMSSCLDARHQCSVTTGLGSTTINQIVLNQKLFGWIQQLNAMLYANKQVLKLIQQSTKCNKDYTSGKDLCIPIGNHVLLRDHPEGCNKIQDRYKSDVYVVVGHHMEPNVYYIHLLNKDKPGLTKVVNQHQLFDLNWSSQPSVAQSSLDVDPTIPSFLHPKSRSSIFLDQHTSDHQYDMRSKCKAATAGRQVEVNTIITHL